MDTYPSRAQQWAVTGLMVLLFLLASGWFAYMNYQADMRSWNLLVSILLLALPLALLFFSIGLLILDWIQKRGQGRISGRLAKLTYLTPRIAGALIIFFVALFSLDVFGQGYSFWETVGAFLMHNIATIIMAVLLALAWKRPVVGFVIFLLAALFFMRFILGGGGFGNLLIFSGPMAVIALLFWVNWQWQKPLAPPAGV